MLSCFFPKVTVFLFFCSQSKDRQSPNTAEYKEQKKREKQRLEREKKEQKEKERRDNEMKKKFKVRSSKIAFVQRVYFQLRSITGLSLKNAHRQCLCSALRRAADSFKVPGRRVENPVVSPTLD